MSVLRNRWLWIIVAVVVVAGLIVLNPLGIGKASIPNYQVEAVARQQLIAAVNSSGSVQPAADVNLTFQGAGQVAQIMTKNGDVVMTDTVLAKLNTDDVQLQVQSAQASLNQAQANLDKVKVGASAKDIANAQAALDQAQANLNKVKTGPGTAEDIAAAQAQVNQAKANLAKVKAGPAAQDIAAAEAAVRQAQASYDKLKQPANAADVQAAQAALDAAKANRDKVKAGADATQIGSAQAKVTQAQNNLDSVKANYAAQKQQGEVALNQAANALRNSQDNLNQVYQQTHDANGKLRTDPPGRDGYFQSLYDQALRTEQDAEGALQKAQDALNAVKQQEIAAVNTAQSQLDDSKSALDKLKAGPTSSELTQAQSQVDQAQASLDKLQRGPTSQDLAAAQATIDQAQANLDKLKAGANLNDIAAAQAQVDQAQANLQKVQRGGNANDIAAAQAQVDQAQNTLTDLKGGAKPTDIAAAQAQVDQAQAALNQAQLRLKNTTLTAPFQGTVVNVAISVGQNVGAGTVAVNMIDTRLYRIDVNVNENDIGGVKLNAAVNITFDSQPDSQPISGTVKFISPKGTTQQGNVIAYLVSILIDSNNNATLRAGQTANTAIITNIRDNAIVVPNRLVRTEGDANVVYVLKGKDAVRTVIKLGLSNDEYSEVTAGLTEGEQIITNPPAARASTLNISGSGNR